MNSPELLGSSPRIEPAHKLLHFLFFFVGLIPPSYAKALVWRGVMESEDDNLLDKARLDLETAIRYDPTLAWGYSVLGMIYNNMARWEDARLVLERAVKLNPKRWQSHYELARAETGEMKFDAALEHLQTPVDLGGDRNQASELKKMILKEPEAYY